MHTTATPRTSPDGSAARSTRSIAGRTGLVALLVTLLAATLSAVPSWAAPAGTASASAPESGSFLSLINDLRGDRGLPPVQRDPVLDDIARRWTDRMISDGKLSHNSSLQAWVEAEGYDGWQVLGENVGFGGDVATIMDSFVASPGHHANLVKAEFVWMGIAVGTGTTTSGHEGLFTTHQFMAYDGTPPGIAPPAPSSSSGAAASSSAPTPATTESAAASADQTVDSVATAASTTASSTDPASATSPASTDDSPTPSDDAAAASGDGDPAGARSALTASVDLDLRDDVLVQNGLEALRALEA